MDGLDHSVQRRKSLKERLGFKGMSCCGATWVFRSSILTVENEEEEEEEEEEVDPQQEHQLEVIDVGQTSPEDTSDQDCVGQTPASAGMNLAAALAAERDYRAAQESDGGDGSPVGPTGEVTEGTPLRVSLMRLLEETDGWDGERETREERGLVGCDSMCCVCMERKKGAAFIPCGHTFCRVCSRELWLNRGSCPLCNRSIIEILDIF
ncbi:hypothetical protein LOK49_LG09G00228 [Camellia lanceoleosa]|uniref:Uncharacterized protein n=1 Tax=Camellia lanceoleosa TaxID=1840588 RepID=A0ACC0GIZ6_9ERIC|nr:hypothetical protein LOK49_LG09G00228 [Camellia lanceoleosa]